MRAVRLSLAGIVSVMLVLATGGTVIAQEDVSTSGVWVERTTEESCVGADPTSYAEQASGDYQVRGMEVTCEATYSDPRLDGTVSNSFNEDCFADGGCVNWGRMEHVGPDGSWSGWFTGTEDPDANLNLYIVMTGTEAFEGLTYVGQASGIFGEPLDFRGVIYEGDPPLVVDAGILAAE